MVITFLSIRSVAAGMVFSQKYPVPSSTITYKYRINCKYYLTENKNMKIIISIFELYLIWVLYNTRNIQAGVQGNKNSGTIATGEDIRQG